MWVVPLVRWPSSPGAGAAARVVMGRQPGWTPWTGTTACPGEVGLPEAGASAPEGASPGAVATSELLEVDDVVGQVLGRASCGRARDAILGQTSAEPPHDGPDDEESDELDEKHPLELDTLWRWSSRAQTEGVGREAELFEAGVGLGEPDEVVVESREDGDGNQGGARLTVDEAERAGGLGLVAGVVGLAEVVVEAGLISGREREQRRVVELLRERLRGLDVGEPFIDAELELGQTEVDVGELVGETAGAEIGGEGDEVFAGTPGYRQRRGPRGEEAGAGLGELGRQWRVERA